MDRRTKDRHEIRMLCHVARPQSGRKTAGQKTSETKTSETKTLEKKTLEKKPAGSTIAGFISAGVESLTENMSRDGMLMRWLDDVPLPELGTALLVEVDLPASGEFGPRVMKCAATVVRITGRPGTKRSVGLRLETVRFTRATKRRDIDLALMRVESDKVN